MNPTGYPARFSVVVLHIRLYIYIYIRAWTKIKNTFCIQCTLQNSYVYRGHYTKISKYTKLLQDFFSASFDTVEKVCTSTSNHVLFQSAASLCKIC